MPWELIYTSAQRGLTTGQSGFCTVARSADLREALVQRLEQISSYHYVEYGGAERPKSNPIISAHRILDIRGTKFHVLSRILPCGLDFTARTNHLAHHLIFGADELIGLPSPAAILQHWDGWRAVWPGGPRWLDPLPPGCFSRLPPPVWPARTWQQLTGDAGRAAGLLEGELSHGCYLITPSGGEQSLLTLFGETLQLLNPAGRLPQRAWQHTFTTFLQGEDATTDFHWRGCQPGTPAYEQAVRRSAKLLPLQAIRIPNNPLSRLAREGPKLPAASAAVPPALAPPTPLGLQWRPAGPPRPVPGGQKPAVPRRDYFHGWTISIRKKSLVGIGIAVVLLVGLLAANYFWKDRLKPTALRPLAAGAGKTNANPADVSRPGPPTAGSPALEPAAPVAIRPAIPQPEVPEPQLNVRGAGRLLDQVLPEVPTYLFVAPTLATNEIALEGIPPLMKLLRQFHTIDLTPRDLDVGFNSNAWGSSSAFKLTLESRPSEHKLIARAAGNLPGNEFLFDYTDLPDQPADADREAVRLQARFSAAQFPPVSSFSLVFQPANHPADRSPFELLVINAAKPPDPLELSKHFLRVGAGKWPAVFREPLRERRTNQFHLPRSSGWQLRPYVNLTNAGGAVTTVDLYEQLPSDARPAPGTELDFAREIQLLTKRRDRQRTDSEFDQGKIDGINKIAQPSLSFDLKVGVMLGLTNDDLASFNTFVAGRNRSSTLFLTYLQQLAETAKPEQTWLEGWRAFPKDWMTPEGESQHFDEVLGRLQELYNMCSAHLSPMEVTNLKVGDAPGNYFVEAWQSFSLAEAIEKFTNDKKLADDNLQREQAHLDLMPGTLDQVAEVRLFLVSANNRLEMIRFTGSGREKLP